MGHLWYAKNKDGRAACQARDERQDLPDLSFVRKPATPLFFRGLQAMTAKIHIERMMHRNSIQVVSESAATYALIKLIPSGSGGSKMGLNLALVVDVSGSMYEEDGTGVSRLKRVQDAAAAAIQKLNPQDNLAIIA